MFHADCCESGIGPGEAAGLNPQCAHFDLSKSLNKTQSEKKEDRLTRTVQIATFRTKFRLRVGHGTHAIFRQTCINIRASLLLSLATH